MLARYAIPKLLGLLVLAAAMVWLVSTMRRSADGRAMTDERIAWRSALDEAFEEARAAAKPVFVEWTAAWCGPCQEMEREAFRDEAVVRLLNERFVPVRLDWDRRRDIATEYRVRVLPTMQVFTPERAERFRLTAKQSPAELESFLRSVAGE